MLNFHGERVLLEEVVEVPPHGEELKVVRVHHNRVEIRSSSCVRLLLCCSAESVLLVVAASGLLPVVLLAKVPVEFLYLVADLLHAVVGDIFIFVVQLLLFGIVFREVAIDGQVCLFKLLLGLLVGLELWVILVLLAFFLLDNIKFK